MTLNPFPGRRAGPAAPGRTVTVMESLTIRLYQESSSPCCALCGRPSGEARGPHLSLTDGEEFVCRDCGKRRAPNLVALLDLAHVAEKVGRTCRHILVPPMEALLALARAAEDYTAAAPPARRKAA